MCIRDRVICIYKESLQCNNIPLPREVPLDIKDLNIFFKIQICKLGLKHSKELCFEGIKDNQKICKVCNPSFEVKIVVLQFKTIGSLLIQ